MAFKYPKTHAAADRAQRSLFILGDALLEECGPPGDDDGSYNSSYSKLLEAQAELSENGIEYEISTLRGYRDTSHRFPPASRVASVSHRVHIECGTPEMLHAILAGWPEGKTLSLHQCSKLMKEIRRRRDEANRIEYEDRHNYAKEQVALAERALSGSRHAVKQSTNLDERRILTAIEVQSERALEDARRAFVQTKPMPKTNFLVPPRPEQVPKMLFAVKLLGAAQRAKTLAIEAMELADEAGSYSLSDDDIGATIEAAILAAEEWRKVAQTLRNKTGLKSSHFTVMGGAMAASD